MRRPARLKSVRRRAAARGSSTATSPWACCPAPAAAPPSAVRARGCARADQKPLFTTPHVGYPVASRDRSRDDDRRYSHRCRRRRHLHGPGGVGSVGGHVVVQGADHARGARRAACSNGIAALEPETGPWALARPRDDAGDQRHRRAARRARRARHHARLPRRARDRAAEPHASLPARPARQARAAGAAPSAPRDHRAGGRRRHRAGAARARRARRHRRGFQARGRRERGGLPAPRLREPRARAGAPAGARAALPPRLDLERDQRRVPRVRAHVHDRAQRGRHAAGHALPRRPARAAARGPRRCTSCTRRAA